ncbi:sugar ABC transporter substrate-binding protein [Actinoplanes sp. L3-i22]|uniref:ABC transporter substrate-binding protein n=1 Tax=Actinoplanes sp. L3-i22 TaxID=2836373 RepID=UPI001C78D017|nr:sugar ABC transporter substrate-binding protein [Actinoplanes sp. L3-i22]BCY12638.1 sugar ABC transporter substrate-binding protein [Actinoplanes sp. L3-i22]
MRRLFPIIAALLLTAGCSIAGGDDANGRTTVTFRLWDERVATAYQQSFSVFEKAHPKVRVEVQVVPWADYWTTLPTDIAAGTAADIFWTNTSNFGLYADNGKLLPVDFTGDWTKSVVDLYTRGGRLWGVPQLWDSIALYYNRDLVSRAGLDPAALTWDPTVPSDTFRAALRKLTVDSAGKHPGEAGFNPRSIATYGVNAALDQQAILWDFAGSNGGTWQSGDRFTFADQPRTVQAVRYVVDLIDKEHVAPPAADTNTDGEKALRLFTQGRIALFQSGPYHLKSIQEGASFRWGIAPLLRGPAGRVGVVHGVAAVASARTRHRDATAEVLRWIGSADGLRPIAAGGYAFPGVTAAQPAFVDYWRTRGVDVRPFLDAAAGTTFPAPVGPRVGAGGTAYTPILQQVFLGQLDVARGLRQAQDAGNAAMRD